MYADYDGIRLAWTLAEIAHAHIEPGEAVPPTIQQKFVRNLKQFVPNLGGISMPSSNPKSRICSPKR